MIRIVYIYKKLLKLNMLRYNKYIEDFITYYENPYSQRTKPKRWVILKLNEIKNSIKPKLKFDKGNKRWIFYIDKDTIITDCWSKKECQELWSELQSELNVLEELYKKYLK